MIDLILKMLDLDNHYGISEEVDIAKGINKQPETVKEGIMQVKRQQSWR